MDLGFEGPRQRKFDVFLLKKYAICSSFGQLSLCASVYKMLEKLEMIINKRPVVEEVLRSKGNNTTV